MLYFVFTIDGDWKEYFISSLSEEKRTPNLKKLLDLIDKEIEVTSKLLDGKFIHFIHTSPRARDFFLMPEFISRWKVIEDLGGGIGIHPHEDDPGKGYYYNDPKRMETAISSFANRLQREGINPIAYRSGYMSFNNKITSILEANRIFLDFSCEPGRYDGPIKGIILSDWRGSPKNFYRMNYEDYRKPGSSKVFEIPVGTVRGRSMNLDRYSVLSQPGIAKKLKREAEKEDFVVSIIAHTYDFAKPFKIIQIKLALSILKRYGRFINAEEALEIVKNKYR